MLRISESTEHPSGKSTVVVAIFDWTFFQLSLMDTNGRERAFFVGALLTDWCQHILCPTFHLKFGWASQNGLNSYAADERLDKCLRWVASCACSKHLHTWTTTANRTTSTAPFAIDCLVPALTSGMNKTSRKSSPSRRMSIGC